MLTKFAQAFGLVIWISSPIAFGQMNTKNDIFEEPNAVTYVCRQSDCQVCMTGSHSHVSTEDTPKNTRLRTNKVCSKRFTGGPAMKSAAEFLDVLAKKNMLSSRSVPSEGFNFSQFVSGRRGSLCETTRATAARLKMESEALGSAADNAQCDSKFDVSKAAKAVK